MKPTPLCSQPPGLGQGLSGVGLGGSFPSPHHGGCPSLPPPFGVTEGAQNPTPLCS